MSFLDDWLKHGGKAPSKLGRFTIKADRWDIKRFEQMLSEMRTFNAERAALCETATETGNGLWADAFNAFNKVGPELVDSGDVQAKYAINRAVMEQALELSEYERLKQWTEGDPVAAASACITMRPELESLMDRTKTAQKAAEELQQKMEELAAAQQEQRDLDELIRDWSAQNPPETPDGDICKFPTLQEAEAGNYQRQQALIDAQVAQLQAEAEAGGEEFEAAKGNCMPGAVGMMKQALGKAAEDAEQSAAMARMWGLDPGTLIRLPADQRMALAKRMKTVKGVDRMYQLWGPLEALLSVEQKRKINNIPEEVYDINVGNDLERVLPAEFGRLLSPVRRLEFFKDYDEKKLLQYAMRGIETVGRGGIVCCIDNSGSMAGDNELWAKAIALCLLDMARRQKRKFYGIHFGSAHEIMEFDFSGEYSVEMVLDFAEYFFGGGTNFVKPCSIALDRLRAEYDNEGRTTADIVFITDGSCGVPEDWKKKWLAEMERIGATMWGLLIGGYRGTEPLSTLCGGKVATIADILDSTKDMAKVFAGL